MSRPKSRKSPRVLLQPFGLLLALAVVAAALLWAAAWRQSSSAGGPLAGLADGRTGPYQGTALKHPEGKVFSFGMILLFNRSDAPVTITKVSILEGEPGLAFRGAWLAGPDRNIGMITSTEEAPPRDPALGTVVPAVGAVLQPDSVAGVYGYNLYVGLEVQGQTRSTIRGVTVRYSSKGKSYTLTDLSTVANCPGMPSTTDCTGEYSAAG